jgi:glycosyltransferase involved in cell wall biosynthesis
MLLSSSHYVFSNYPLSADFRRRLELDLGEPPSYLSLPELRQLPLPQIVRRFRGMRGGVLSIPLEDESAKAVLPLLKIVAGFSDARVVEIVRPDLSRERVSRIDSVQAVLALLLASVSAYLSLRKTRSDLKRLLRVSRIEPQPSTRRKIFYLNANLWFGVKAGGSVGHVAGVANGLLKSGFELDFASAGGRQLVAEEAPYIALKPPKTFGMPFEINYYRFSNQVLSQVDPLLDRDAFAFLYQRMSIANCAGVHLSRRHNIPLVLEYNGSEAWIAKNWGRPLRYHVDAVAAEDACLRHAHVVVTISDVLREELIARGVDPSRIVFYPNCIDPQIFDPNTFSDTNRQELRDRYRIPRDAVVAEFVGTFGQWHGVDFLAKSIRVLAESDPEWLRKHRVHFLIVGDGLKMSDVRRILDVPECAPFYTLAGLVPQKDAPRHLAAADILLSPHVANPDGTRFFGSPTKLFEYMAMGKSILASDLDQIGEVLGNSVRFQSKSSTVPDQEGQLATLFDPGDIAGFIAGLRFLVENPERRERLGANARREALARYTWAHHVEAILIKLRGLNLLV